MGSQPWTPAPKLQLPCAPGHSSAASKGGGKREGDGPLRRRRDLFRSPHAFREVFCVFGEGLENTSGP
eukprot:4004935-Pyramimonas_sp.AAC.1